MLKENVGWSFMRMVLLGVAAWFFSAHASNPVAADTCAASCTEGQQDPNGNCISGATCNKASKGSTGVSCTVSGCSCTWGSGSCTGS